MRALAAGILVSSLCSAPLLAQDRDRSIERISVALQNPPPIARDVPLADIPPPTRLGIFTLVPPTSRGEMIRLSIPIGELVVRAFDGISSVNRRRQEAAARRRVNAALEAFAEQQRRQPR